MNVGITLSLLTYTSPYWSSSKMFSTPCVLSLPIGLCDFVCCKRKYPFKFQLSIFIWQTTYAICLVCIFQIICNFVWSLVLSLSSNNYLLLLPFVTIICYSPPFSLEWVHNEYRHYNSFSSDFIISLVTPFYL